MVPVPTDALSSGKSAERGVGFKGRTTTERRAPWFIEFSFLNLVAKLLGFWSFFLVKKVAISTLFLIVL